MPSSIIEPPTRAGLGHILVIISALSFAAGSSLAVVSYQAGASALSVITVRILFTIFALQVFIRATRGATRLPPRERNLALVLGFLLAVQSYTLYRAIDLMPVALAILTFYVYPLLIGLGAHVTGQDRINVILGVGLLGAFLGLALALDVSGGGLDILGIGLAVLSAATFAIIAIAMQPMIRRIGDSRPITLHMHYTAVFSFAAIVAVLGEFPLPDDTTGWMAFAAVSVFYAVAVTTFFIAVAHIGPVRASLVMNLEPIAAIVFGFILLGQALTGTQLAGAAIVIATIAAVRLESARRAARA